LNSLIDNNIHWVLLYIPLMPSLMIIIIILLYKSQHLKPNRSSLLLLSVIT
jgi:hypothetical protein